MSEKIFHHNWFYLQPKWFSNTISVLTQRSWCDFWCADLQAFKWDNLVALGDGLRLLGDGYLQAFKHEVPITFGDNANDWLLVGL